MIIHDNITTCWGNPEDINFLCYIPVLDPEYKGCTYYSCENTHPNKIYDRVVPCYHLNVDDDWKNPHEDWFFRETLPKGIRHDLVLEHAVLRDEYVHRFNTMKYIVRFIGCDDGDKIMRFHNKEDALEFLNSTKSFDEIYDNDFLMEYM